MGGWQESEPRMPVICDKGRIGRIKRRRKVRTKAGNSLPQMRTKKRKKDRGIETAKYAKHAKKDGETLPQKNAENTWDE